MTTVRSMTALEVKDPAISLEFYKRLGFTEPSQFMNVIEFIRTFKFRSLTGTVPLIMNPYQLAPPLSTNLIKK